MSDATITVETGNSAETVAEESAADAVATAAEAVAVAAETTLEAAEAIAEAENGDDDEWLTVFLMRLESVEASLAGISETLRLMMETQAQMQGELIAGREAMANLLILSQPSVAKEAEVQEATAETIPPAASADGPQEAATKRGRNLRLM